MYMFLIYLYMVLPEATPWIASNTIEETDLHKQQKSANEIYVYRWQTVVGWWWISTAGDSHQKRWTELFDSEKQDKWCCPYESVRQGGP